MSKRKVLLIEPNYKNKYPPMGLMKIATYCRCRGDDVRFYKGDLKILAAQLLLEEYLEKADRNVSIVDSNIYSYIKRRGTSSIIEYIRTGKHAPLEMIADFSNMSNKGERISKEILLKTLGGYRTRYKNQDFPTFDRVCVSTLFTFYWKETIDTINYAKNFLEKYKMESLKANFMLAALHLALYLSIFIGKLEYIPM